MQQPATGECFTHTQLFNTGMDRVLSQLVTKANQICVNSPRKKDQHIFPDTSVFPIASLEDSLQL